MVPFENSEQYALSMDEQDSLKDFRNQFYIPVIHGRDALYFTGNSLGLEPRSTQEYVLNELEEWASYGVEGHFHAATPWYHYQDSLTLQLAEMMGAEKDEVVAMNTLTTNLHLLLVSFYRPQGKRYKILCEYDAFPSDLYALQSQVLFHGYSPEDALIFLRPRPGEYILRTEDIQKTIEKNRDTIASVMLGAVNYYTGQFFELDKITKAAHDAGATAGFNLAHAAGNVPLKLHEWDVDYACFCSYKYLNAGPGGVSGIFIHNRHATDSSLPRFAGWWGNDPETRFSFPRTFIPAKGARGWQLSNAPVLPMAALKASLDIFSVAGLERLYAKSRLLTSYLEFLIDDINTAKEKTDSGQPVTIITPRDPESRGCQISMVVRNGRSVFEKLTDAGCITDWREPDVIRVAPVPLYNSFMDVYRFAAILGTLV
ncbi:MAG: kynureninase [Bacteroidia bacterium]|nr:kynureninase [Bacteroidia bacterium]